MDKKIGNFIEILLEEKESIKELKEIISEKDSLVSRINKIKTELGNINTSLGEIEKAFKEKESKIDKVLKKVEKLHFDTLLEGIGAVEQVIRGNLPKDIYGGDKKCVGDKDVLRCIPLFRMGTSFQVGQIEIYKTDINEFKVKVHIEDDYGISSKNQEFVITEPLRIYKVISYIHTNLSYDE